MPGQAPPLKRGIVGVLGYGRVEQGLQDIRREGTALLEIDYLYRAVVR